MTSHTLDLGFTARQVEDCLTSIGYWGTAARREHHACVLTPSAYVLREERQLIEQSTALYAAVGKLETTLAALPRLRRIDHRQSQLLRLARSASHGLLQPGEDRATDIPPIVKLDMVRDAAGNWHAVEVDTYNLRPLGVIALVDAIAKYGLHEPAYCVVSHLAATLGNDRQWTIVVSEKERCYRAAYETLASLLAKMGTSVRLLGEEEAAHNPSLLKCRDGPLHLLAIPESLDRHPGVREHLLAEYRARSVRTLYPPKAYLGSKAFLPFLASQERVNGSIPATALLTGNIADCTFSRPRTGERIILKSAHSSGSKGIVRQSNEPSFQKTVAEEGRARTPLWVAQQEVSQEPIPVVVFAGNKRVVRSYYLRLTVYATQGGIAGMKMTGRPEEIVHGAPDAIQLPIIRAPRWQQYLSSMC
ncbi:hypothetical protein HY971_00685 [Candidatus Kaiserbacteria bacterium]|nr:hypothetical protein [Candidatus Kaiserbacteria bacterium]